MRYVRITFWTLLFLVAAGFLHYTLPRTDVVRIVETEVRRVEVPPNAVFWAGSEPVNPQSQNRDVKFVSALHTDGHPRVYRNEDTGWSWPPYFKFDSADLQARASDSVSSEADPRWFAVHYYGVRSNLFSIYPNVLGMSPVDGPDVRTIPWTRIVVLTLLAVGILILRALVKRFWRRRVDPVVRDVSEAFESADDAVDERLARSRRDFRGRRERFREWWVELFG